MVNHMVNVLIWWVTAILVTILVLHTQHVESDNLEEPDLPANYQMEEYVKARAH